MNSPNTEPLHDSGINLTPDDSGLDLGEEPLELVASFEPPTEFNVDEYIAPGSALPPQPLSRQEIVFDKARGVFQDLLTDWPLDEPGEMDTGDTSGDDHGEL